jgi:hypothetical protein
MPKKSITAAKNPVHNLPSCFFKTHFNIIMYA